MALASDAIIIGFQARPTHHQGSLLRRKGVQIKTYSIIYEAIEEIKSAMEGMLNLPKKKKLLHLDVRETYKMSKLRLQDAMSLKAKSLPNTLIRVIRDGIVIFLP